MRNLVLNGLIEGEWIEQEAARERIEVTEEQVSHWYESLRHTRRRAEEAGGDSSAYAAALALARENDDGRRTPVRIDILRQELMEKRAPHPSVSLQAAHAYFREHEGEFHAREVRYFHVIVTRTRSRALEAKGALQHGIGWREASRRYSLEDVYLRHPSGWQGTAEGEFSEPLNGRLFNAPRTTLQGPLKTPSGWFVFEVVRVQPAHAQPFHRVRAAIRGRLTDEKTPGAGSQLTAQLRAKYMKVTRCAKAFHIPGCRPL